jgi:hypothetical protein
MRDDCTRERQHEDTTARGGDCTTARIHEYDMEKIRSHKDLKVFQLAYECALELHEISKSFPPEEKYSYPVKYLSRQTINLCSNCSS